MGKTEADYLKKIDITWLKKQRFLCGYNSGNIKWTSPSGQESSIGVAVDLLEDKKFIHFQYTQTDYDGKKTDFDYNVPIVSTPCNFGGKRYWFICSCSKNDVYCGRRVGVLYKGGDYFACRHCYDLTYSSRNENHNQKYHALFASLKITKRIDDLREKIKRPFYAGKPTRNQRSLEGLFEKFSNFYPSGFI